MNDIKIGIWDENKYLIEVTKIIKNNVYCRILKSLRGPDKFDWGTDMYILKQGEKGRLLLEPTKRQIREAEIIIQKMVEKNI